MKYTLSFPSNYSIALSLIGFLFAIAQPLGLAEEMSTGTSLPTQQAPQKATENDQFKKIALAKPVTLPNIPIYSGAATQYIAGNMLPNMKGGPVVTMQYAVEADPKVVIQWYRHLLCKHSWCFMDNMNGTEGFVAIDKDNVFQVTVSRPATPGAKSGLMLLYKFNKNSNLIAER